MLPLRATVDLTVMAMKRYFVFPKVPALLMPHHQIVYYYIQRERERKREREREIVCAFVSPCVCVGLTFRLAWSNFCRNVNKGNKPHFSPPNGQFVVALLATLTAASAKEWDLLKKWGFQGMTELIFRWGSSSGDQGCME